MPERDVGDAAAIGRPGELLDDQDGDAADDQRPGDDHRIAEQQLDLVAERQAEDDRRDEGHEHVADEAPWRSG